MCNLHTVSFTSFQFGFLLIIFLVWLLWLGLPILCWAKVVRVSIFVLFLILEEMLSAFHIEYDVGCGFVIYGLNMLRYVPSILCIWVFIMKGCWNLSKAFSIYWDNPMIFILQFVNMVYHIDRFMDVEPSLHPWDKSHLIMVYDPFNVLLDSVC